VLIIQQLLLFLVPALLMTITLVADFTGTFRLRRPRLTSVAVAVTLAVALHPLVQEMMQHLQWFFPQGLPDGSQEFLRTMLGVSQPGWLVFLAVAITPAFCEEFLFRGFVLSAIDRPGRRRLAVVLSALAFGAVHMIPQQVFYATLLGLVLGLLAIRTGSIWPGVAFHLTFNGIAVLQERWPLPQHVPAWGEWLVSIDGDGGLRYGWPLMIAAAILVGLLLRCVTQWTEPGSVK
jgi:sodium transport system permease protein